MPKPNLTRLFCGLAGVLFSIMLLSEPWDFPVFVMDRSGSLHAHWSGYWLMISILWAGGSVRDLPGIVGSSALLIFAGGWLFLTTAWGLAKPSSKYLIRLASLTFLAQAAAVGATRFVYENLVKETQPPAVFVWGRGVWILVASVSLLFVAGALNLKTDRQGTASAVPKQAMEDSGFSR
jgi:hypothetical protein